MEPANLLDLVNRVYRLDADRIELLRDMIGSVYLMQDRHRKYVLKVYRGSRTDDALQTVRILSFLQACSYPSVSVIRTAENEGSILLDRPDGCCAAILYEYADGETPDAKAEAECIGRQIGELHNLMQRYPHQLISRTKADYIDDYIAIMNEKGFDSGKTADLQRYGNELWGRVTRLPRGFCHGDLHTGNMIRNQHGEYVLFDFDDASGDYPSMDVAYMSDDTNFNRYDDSMYDSIVRQYEQFYRGYGKVKTISDSEYSAVFDFIAVRHFQIISRIVRCRGTQSLDEQDCAEQYDWLMKWRELCIRRRQ